MCVLPADPGPRIRSALREDVPRMLAIYHPIVTSTAISFEEQLPTEQAFAERVQATQVLAPWLVCEEGEVLLGYAYARAFRPRPAYRWSMESSVYVHADHCRRGTARALYAALFGILRIQGYRTVLAGITLPNEASVRVHEQLGFRPCGVFRSVGHKHDRWHDVGFWQLTLAPHDSNPGSPVPPSAVLSSPSGRSLLRKSADGVRPSTPR